MHRPPPIAPLLPTPAPRSKAASLSTALHLLAVLVLTGFIHRAPTLAPYKLPGTAHGERLLTYFSPGSPQQSAVTDLPQKLKPKPTQAPATHTATAAPTPPAPQPPAADRGLGSSSESGLGDGDISIATVKQYTHPSPDLSTLPHGSRGDVILDAVIDEHGSIQQLTLLKGLGTPIDDAVIATVRQWSYSPATKNGVPIPSEQELHFHYERS